MQDKLIDRLIFITQILVASKEVGEKLTEQQLIRLVVSELYDLFKRNFLDLCFEILAYERLSTDTKINEMRFTLDEVATNITEKNINKMNPLLAGNLLKYVYPKGIQAHSEKSKKNYVLLKDFLLSKELDESYLKRYKLTEVYNKIKAENETN